LPLPFQTQTRTEESQQSNISTNFDEFVEDEFSLQSKADQQENLQVAMEDEILEDGFDRPLKRQRTDSESISSST